MLLCEDIEALGQGLLAAAGQVKTAHDEARQSKAAAAALMSKLDQLHRQGGSQAIAGLRQDMRVLRSEQETLEETVVSLVTAVTSLHQKPCFV